MQRFVVLLSVMLIVPLCTSQAQDPSVVDADHYKVEFENEHVRVVRITYGAGEKSVMHDHPDGVAVYLTDATVKMNLPDGSTVDLGGKANHADWAPGGKHLPQNVGDEPLELILVELKATAKMKVKEKEKEKADM